MVTTFKKTVETTQVIDVEIEIPAYFTDGFYQYEISEHKIKSVNEVISMIRIPTHYFYDSEVAKAVNSSPSTKENFEFALQSFLNNIQL